MIRKVSTEDMTKWAIDLGGMYHITFRKDGTLRRLMINLPFGYWEFKWR